MEKFILGKKVAMSQIWRDGKVIPVTRIQADANTVALVRIADRDGYDAVQLRLGARRKEFRVSAETRAAFADRSSVTVDAFTEGERVRVSGYSRGKGFQGVVKRHGFSGGPKTHGQKNRYRAPGSIGSTMAQRVFKGKRMAGRMGNNRVTRRSMEIVSVLPEARQLLVKGAVPGHRGSIVEISA
ncbi:MAG: 50S ribosomal protein L3 [Candidatus Liptonbacteria bacterium]|nr:50S ribosomal protein L3 [Candidatus Liptonbacteria bacterium]